MQVHHFPLAPLLLTQLIAQRFLYTERERERERESTEQERTVQYTVDY